MKIAPSPRSEARQPAFNRAGTAPVNRIWRLVLLLPMLLLAACASQPEPKPIALIAFPKPPDTPRFYHERTVLGTGELRQTTSKDRLRALLTGSSEKSGLGFTKPFDVAVHHGRVFVSDSVQRLVLALDFQSGSAFEIGARGDAGDLFKPLGLAVDAQGRLYVCDTQLKKVLIYDRDGNWLRSIDLQAQTQRPSGIEINPEGTRLFVVDVGGVKSTEHGILVYDASDGRFLRRIGERGKQPGQFNLPRDLTLSPDGLLYVTDGGNFRVQAIREDGSPVRAWGSPGRHLGQFTRPKGIAADRQGNLYVVDAAFGNFQIFSPTGDLLLYIGERSETPGPAKFMLPSGIAVDEDGRVYVIDQFYRKLEVFRPADVEPLQAPSPGSP